MGLVCRSKPVANAKGRGKRGRLCAGGW